MGISACLCMYVFMHTCVSSILASMHTYKCIYACMNVWVHATRDWSAGHKSLDDGGWGWEAQSGGGPVGDGVNRSRVEDGGTSS